MKNKWIYWCGLAILVFFCLPATAWAEATEAVGVAYRGHIQNIGDYPLDGTWVNSPEPIGTVGQSKRIEGFEIRLEGQLPAGLALRYNVHVQNKGWLYDEDDPRDWPKDGAYAGTRGEGLRIEAVKLVLTDADGQLYPGYSVQYRGHVQNVGDLPAAAGDCYTDGQQLGTVGSSLRLEALLVTVVKKETDLTAYKALLAEIDKMTAVDYTVSSWTALQAVLDSQVVTADQPQLDVNAAVDAIQSACDGLVKKAPPQRYDTAGTYGPTEGSQTLAGDVVVAADGVILNNLVIDGNLTIAETVGDGNVTLNNITVKGDTLVRGGGVNSIHINGGQYGRIIMEKTASGGVRIVAVDAAGLEVVITDAAAGETVILEGAFASVTVNAPNMTVTTQGATTTIDALTVGAEAGGSTLNLASGTTVTELVLEGKAAVKGQGTVAKAEVKADGVVFEKKPDAYTVEPEVQVPPVIPSDSGGGYTPPPPVAVTGVSLPDKLDLLYGDSNQLTATLAPVNASNQAVSFSSSDPNVAEVAADGLVSTSGVGTTTITVTTADGGFIATCQVMVRPRLIISASQLLAGTTDNYLALELLGDIIVDEDFELVGTTTTGLTLGTAIQNQGFSWKLPLIGQAQPGTLTLILKANGYSYGIDSAPLTVEILAPTDSLTAGSVNETTASFTFAAQSGASAVTLQQKLASAGNDAWAAATLAAPLDGQSTAAMVTGLTSGDSYDFRLLVVGGATPGASNRVGLTTRVPVTGVTLSQTGPLSLAFGETVTLTATVEPANATEKTVTWTSTNPAILRSDGDGKFTAVGTGTATIVAMTNVATAGCSVTVAAPNLIRGDAITAIPEPFAGQTPVESFEVKLADGSTKEYSGTVAWTETDTPGATFTKFDGSKAYTATMTLTAAPGYQFEADTDFAVDGADTATTTIGDYGLTATVTATYGVKARYVIDGNGVITAYSGPGGDLVVPGTIDAIVVKGIGDRVFKNNQSLTKVTLPATVLTIGNYAFSGCPDLATLTFAGGSQPTTIGDYAFSGCSLTTLSLPANVTAIGNHAFDACTGLVTLTFEGGSQPTTIGDYAFSGCPLTTLSLSATVTTIGEYAFAGSVLTTLSLPATVMTIGEYAFAGNKLTQLTFNNSDGSALTIGPDAFKGSEEYGKNLITKITLPSGVTIPDSSLTGGATMGVYGAAFKSFYESTETGGNNSAGGIFVYDATNGWGKTP